MADHLRRVYRQPPRGELALDPMSEDELEGAAEEKVLVDGLEEAWDQEWEQSVLDAAVAQVRERVNPKHFQVFDCCVRQGRCRVQRG